MTHDLRGLTPEEYIELDRWHGFFKNHRDYSLVGTVKLPDIDPTIAVPPACPPPDWETNRDSSPSQKRSDESVENTKKEQHQEDSEHSKNHHHHRKPIENVNEKESVLKHPHANAHDNPAVKEGCHHKAAKAAAVAEEKHHV